VQRESGLVLTPISSGFSHNLDSYGRREALGEGYTFQGVTPESAATPRGQ
jgi:hypothetical protein